MFYVLIPRIEIQAANALSNPMLINAAPIMAAALFGHSFCMPEKLGAASTGVAVVHHDAQMLGEEFYGRFYPQQRRASGLIDKQDYVGSTIGLSLQPTATCHLTISLIFEFENFVEEVMIKDIVETSKIAGGSVIRFGKVVSSHDLDDVVRKVGFGFWINERSDLMKAEDPVGSMISAIGSLGKTEIPVEDEENASEEVPKKEAVSDAWVIPTTLGYALISDIKPRQNARKGFEHAFSEPMMGLVQYQSVRNKNYGIKFWRHKWLADDVFVVAQ